MRGAVCADARLNPHPPDVVFSLIVWEQMAGEKWNGRLPGDLLLVTCTCYHGDCPLIAGGHRPVCGTELRLTRSRMCTFRSERACIEAREVH